MNKEQITKEDILNVTGSMFDTMLDYVDNSNNELEKLQQQNKKYKEVIDKLEKYIKKETRIYGLSMSIELGTHFDNILGILKEVE